jgi:hypothetical protein
MHIGYMQLPTTTFSIMHMGILVSLWSPETNSLQIPKGLSVCFYTLLYVMSTLWLAGVGLEEELLENDLGYSH